MTIMTTAEAIQILVDCASRWGENAEEAFPRRINPFDSDTELGKLAGEAGETVDSAIEIRNLWQAIKVAETHLNKIVEGAPR